MEERKGWERGKPKGVYFEDILLLTVLSCAAIAMECKRRRKTKERRGISRTLFMSSSPEPQGELIALSTGEWLINRPSLRKE